MASLTKYAGTVTQTTGGSYVSWLNLNNVKNNASGSWATSNGRVKGKSSSPNRPSPVSCTNFSFNLPTGAEVTGVKVTYRHMKQSYNGHVCNIPAPTISLLGVSGFSGKGSAPTTTLTTFSKSFTGKALTRTIVNSSSFGVKIDYPTNTNSYEGSMSISLVNIVITYKTSEYSLGLKKASGGYNEEDYVLESSISNKNFTSYNPSLTLSAPAGFSFRSGSGTGEFTRVNNRTIIWNPKLTSKVGTSTCRFVFDTNVTFPTGVDAYTGTFTLVESLNSTTKTFTATIQHRPPSTSEETSTGTTITDTNEGLPLSQIIYVEQDEIFSITTIFSTQEQEQIYYIGGWNDPNFERAVEDQVPVGDQASTVYMKNNATSGDWQSLEYIIPVSVDDGLFDDEGHLISEFKATSVGDYDIVVRGKNDEDFTYTKYYKIRVTPSELTTPYFTMLTLTEEELNRLGDGFTYIAQAFIKQDSNQTYPLKWGKSYRIGIFNEEDNEYSDEELYANTLYWSDTVTSVNAYENLECEFTYNKNNPLYILITGDYTETEDYSYTIGKVNFTEPCIIEKTVYNGPEQTGNYPIPILGLIDSEEEDMSTITLPAEQVGTSVRLYNFPLDDNYGTNDDLAVRGIQVNGTVESTDNIIVYCKLYSPNGDMGQRSIVLTDDDEFNIGGLGDLWGFNTLSMQNLEDWELEFSTLNLLNNSESTLQLKDITVTFYIEQIERQEVSVSINGEPLEYYGCFIEEVKIPEGLNTNTAYINVDGTDINDAYRQNIKEKEIELKFNISACDLKTSTDMLRQVTKLLVNEKDQYNRPIPNTVTFTHYPNDYFEYILENTLEVTSEVTGYNVTAKLTIPAGTSYSIDDTVTNVVGYANGLAAINPIITLQPSSSNIEVRETLSGQSFNIGFSGDWNNKIVEIDCIDRRVYLKDNSDDEGTDISKYVDHNADWFRLSGEYSFEGINCIIRTVTFNERW